MALIKKFIEEKDGHGWYDIYSDTEGKAVKVIETNEVYEVISMRDDCMDTYEEVDNSYM